MKFVGFILILLFFISANPVNSCANQAGKKYDAIEYKDIKEECYRLIRHVHQNLHILEWSDSFVKDILKEQLEDYLMAYLNTPESLHLCAKYEAVDWNIHEMMKMHLNDKEL